MKRILTLTLAVLMLASLLCACSATGTVDPYYSRSNVSTTHDGRVNGTNDRYKPPYHAYESDGSGSTAGVQRQSGAANASGR